MRIDGSGNLLVGRTTAVRGYDKLMSFTARASFFVSDQGSVCFFSQQHQWLSFL
jgi:hypothetical protein